MNVARWIVKERANRNLSVCRYLLMPKDVNRSVDAIPSHRLRLPRLLDLVQNETLKIPMRKNVWGRSLKGVGGEAGDQATKSANTETVRSIRPASNSNYHLTADDIVQSVTYNAIAGIPYDTEVLYRNGYDRNDLLSWIKCVKASSMSEALCDSGVERWPEFLINFTLRRPCNSRTAAMAAMNLFTSSIETSSNQFSLFAKMVKIAQKCLPDLLPDICRLYVKSCREPREYFFNHALWLLVELGSKKNAQRASIVVEAQRIIVDKMMELEMPLDTKGYSAISQSIVEVYPDKLEAFEELFQTHAQVTSLEENAVMDASGNHPSSLPYQYGLEILQMKNAKDKDSLSRILSNVRGVPPPIFWSLFLKRVKDLGYRIDEVADKVSKQNKIDSYLLQQILDPVLVWKNCCQITNLCMSRMGTVLNNSTISFLIKKMLQHSSLSKARIIISMLDQPPTLAMLNTLIFSEATRSPSTVWKTYQKLAVFDYEPDNYTLLGLCKAAKHSLLDWDSIYAPQRATVEFKTYVRGANVDGSDANDMNKIYPSQELFYHYIVMIGEAKYDNELLEVLPWMDRIGFVPNKQCLCALICYSPNRDYLIQHAKLAGGEWPQEDELERYERRTRKR